MSLARLIENGNKRYGLNTFVTGMEYSRDYKRIPTGIFPLDMMLAGGFPTGVTSAVWGPPGGFKSGIILKLAASLQNMCANCMEYTWDCKCRPSMILSLKPVIVSSEIMDMEWAALLGVDPENVVIVQPDFGEQAVDIISEVMDEPECGLVIVDSVSMLTPTIDLEGSAVDVMPGIHAKLQNKLLRRVKVSLIRARKQQRPLTFIGVNHVAANFGQSFGFAASEKMAGSFMSKHDWHLTVRMSQLKSDLKDKDTDLPIKGRFKASITQLGSKRKVMTLAGSSEFFVGLMDVGDIAKGQVLDHKTFIKYAESVEALTKDPWTLLGKEYGKKQDIIDKLHDDENFYLSAKKKVVEMYVDRAKEMYGIDELPIADNTAEEIDNEEE